MGFLLLLQNCAYEWMGHGDLCDLYHSEKFIQKLCEKENLETKKILISKLTDITYEDLVIEVPVLDIERLKCELETNQSAYRVVSFEMNDPTIDFKEVILKIRNKK